MLDYPITNAALIKLHVHVTKHRGVEVKKCLWGWTFHFHFIFSRADISLLSVLFSINSVQLQILYIDCCLEKNQRNYLKPSQLTSDSKMSPQTSNTIHRTDSVNAKCGYFQEIVKFAPHSTLLLIPQLPAHLLPFHLQ